LQPGGVGLLLHPLAQPIGVLLQSSPAIKRRVRNVRRLQLLWLNLFNERIQLDMHRCDSEPVSKPMQPQVSDFRADRAIARAAVAT
jgi:hypothetical protein